MLQFVQKDLMALPTAKMNVDVLFLHRVLFGKAFANNLVH